MHSPSPLLRLLLCLSALVPLLSLPVRAHVLAADLYNGDTIDDDYDDDDGDSAAYIDTPDTQSAALSPPPYDRLVVFGDSLSDNGNGTFVVSDGQVPPKPYFQGRYSDGLTWAEQLSLALGGADNLNYAYGGSASNNEYVQANVTLRDGALVALPDCRDQIETYFEAEAASGDALLNDARTLHVVWTGHNDLIKKLKVMGNSYRLRLLALPDYQEMIAENVVANVRTLVSKGARNILLMELAPLDRTPLLTQFYLVSQLARHIIGTINAAIREKLKALLTELKPDQKIFRYSARPFFKAVMQSPGDYGIVNAAKSCVLERGTQRPPHTVSAIANVTVCARPQSHMFFDGIHPTSTTHKLLAADLYRFLQKNEQIF